MDDAVDDDAEWDRREHKRLSAVGYVKATEMYSRLLVVSGTGELADNRRPRTPDPFDRTLSKRHWERKCADWRMSLRSINQEFGPTPMLGDDSTGYMQVCLVNALRRHGIPVVAPRDGPFWALRDGNTFLMPFGMELVHIGHRPLPRGRYVMWTPSSDQSHGHFVAVLCGDALLVVAEEDKFEQEIQETEHAMFYLLAPVKGMPSSDHVLGGGSGEEDQFEDVLDDLSMQPELQDQDLQDHVAADGADEEDQFGDAFGDLSMQPEL